ncbi:hypothetical protein [Ewingella americana]|uniref:hypothetical protein n=1 Tax=Ewingella americana TaxID=41202 RepID=UPI00163AEB59|nr:hypothetical protein [Ewingella americana]QMV50947.1 hypothetical protein GXP68_05950 [Ewingella americana]
MESNYIAYEALITAREATFWAFWSMVGTWVAGIMTFAAVCISLIVSFRRPVPRIMGTASPIIIMPNSRLTRSGIGLNIYNRGSGPVNITSIIWNFGKNTRLYYPVDPSGHTIPKKLETGESATFFFWNDESNGWAENVKNNVLESGGKINKLRLEISVGTGDVFYIPPTKEVLKIINN